MPKILEKRSVLNGRGTVVQYGSGTSAGAFFYRELVKGTRSYRQMKIPEVSSMDEAVNAAVDIAFKLQSKEVDPEVKVIISNPNEQRTNAADRYQSSTIVRLPKKQKISDAVNSFLKREEERVSVGLIAKKTKLQKEITLTQHMLPYLESKGIFYTTQINENTFKDYEIFRAQSTKLTRNNEITQIKDFCRNYLVANRLIKADLMMNRDFLSRMKISQTDRLRNPAINPEDWDTIIRYVEGPYRNSATLLQNHRIHYWRTLFWHFILFAKNSGMSPEEILKLKWKQIEIVDEGRDTGKGEEESWEVCYVFTIRSKTKQTREVPVNQARELRRWKKYQEDYLKERGIKAVITRDTLVFGNPHNEFKAYGYSNYQRSWSDVREAVKGKLLGHRFSEHNYTIYSMRSTFIEDHLLKGTPVFTVAEMVGHSIVETQRTYARLNLRQKGREITQPQAGKKAKRGSKVDLFEDSTD